MSTRTNEIDAGRRYAVVSEEKAVGATYTPEILADFVAEQMVKIFDEVPVGRPLRVLDPAIGDGQLLISLLEQIGDRPELSIEVHGFDTDQNALDTAYSRLRRKFGAVSFYFESSDFLEFVLEHFGTDGNGGLFAPKVPEAYDLIIANPPYVRTQIMGSQKAQVLSQRFCLSGRVDLYHAFIPAMAQVLKPKGIAGIIVSNRFMTTRSGASVRRALMERFNLRGVWDFGDSRLFDAAVLPAVLLAQGRNGDARGLPEFTSIYETRQSPTTRPARASSPIEALSHTGVVEVEDGREFLVRHGKLNTSGSEEGVWRIATRTTDDWLSTVKAHTWKTFGDVGKICVGVKTCADKVFIRSDWHEMREVERPELLRPLITHHIARRFKALEPDVQRQIIYPHETVQGRRRAADLLRYPNSKAYLEKHRDILQRRKYLIEAGRKWYEIWVSQDPSAWDKTKLVFRDIAEEPTFWIDQSGAVVNGDCYWMVSDDPDRDEVLWLGVAVGNSRFIERFYDTCFHNKLYAGRRRFITQYVEKFPLPDPDSDIGKAIIADAKEVYAHIPSLQADKLQEQLERMIWKAFGVN